MTYDYFLFVQFKEGIRMNLAPESGPMYRRQIPVSPVETWNKPPEKVRRSAGAVLAAALFRDLARRLPFQMAISAENLVGDKASSLPTLILHRPEAFYSRVARSGLIGLGESYQAGDWDSDDLVGLLCVFAEDLEGLVPKTLQRLRRFYAVRRPREHENDLHGARRNIKHHYDLSNEVFRLFLDETMSYSCALFDVDIDLFPNVVPEVLGGAQQRKYDRLLDITNVSAGTKLLEIGTGWGELAIRAAQRGAEVVTVTLSTEQKELAEKRAYSAGVSDRVDVRLCDYREIRLEATRAPRGFDAIISVEMLEAVGEKYWPVYFSTLERLLAVGGAVGLQTATMRHHRMMATRQYQNWIDKYIFPGGLIPSVAAVDRTLRDYTSLRIFERLAFGAHYAETLRLWREQFVENSPSIIDCGFGDMFLRTWRFYLAYAESGFRSGYTDVQQLLLRRF